MTPAEKDLLEKQEAKELRDSFLNKLIGTEFVYTNSVVRNKDTQLDKFKVLIFHLGIESRSCYKNWILN